MAAPKAKTLQQKLGFYDDDLKKPSHDVIMTWVHENADKVIRHIFNFSDFSTKEVDAIKNLTLRAMDKQFYKKSKGQIERKPELYQRYEPEIPITDQDLSFGELPERQPAYLVQSTWEYAVTSQSHNTKTGYSSQKSVIGFIDLKLDFQFSRLCLHNCDIFTDATKNHFPKEVYVLKYDGEFRWHQRYCPASLFVEVKTSIESLGVLFRQLNTYREYLPGHYLVVCPDDQFSEMIQNQGFFFLKYDKDLFID